MRGLFRNVRRRARTPFGRKALRYALVSAVSVVVGQASLFVLFAGLRWSASTANFLAFALAGVVSYLLNRRWAWGKRGRSHVMKEIVPFVVIAVAGLALSTWAARLAESFALQHTSTRAGQGLIVNAATLLSFSGLWIGKFVLFNKVLFAVRDPDLRAALEEEVVA